MSPMLGGDGGAGHGRGSFRWLAHGLVTVTLVVIVTGFGRVLDAAGRRGDRVGRLHPGRHVADDLVGVAGAEDAPALSSRTMKNCEPTEFGAGVPGHRDRAALVRRRHRLVLDRVAGAAGAGARRVAALDDERRPRTAPMERRAVVEAARRERDEVAGRDRRQVGLDLDRDGPLSVSSVTVRVSPAGSASAGWSGSAVPAARGLGRPRRRRRAAAADGRAGRRRDADRDDGPEDQPAAARDAAGARRGRRRLHRPATRRARRRARCEPRRRLPARLRHSVELRGGSCGGLQAAG